jgi:nitrogen fixation protein FixH
MSNEYPPKDARTKIPSSASGETQAQPLRVTGWMVFGFMIAFFAIIVGVNVFMAHAAISTFAASKRQARIMPGKCSNATLSWQKRRMPSIGR